MLDIGSFPEGVESMFCTKCGTNISTDAHYCYSCGTVVPEVAPLPSEPPNFAEDSNLSDSTPGLNRSPGRNPNLLVKHWRGDYSLGVSYWVIGNLSTFVVVVITTLIGSSTGLSELGPKASGAAILAIYGFAVIATFWQLGGIWRSADKHTQKGGKAFWAGFAKLMVVIGLLRFAADFTTVGLPLISEGAKMLVGVDDTPPYQIRLLREGTELELAGGMPFGTNDAIKKFLDATPAIQVLHLNSQGGRMAEAYLLYKTIKERNLSTFTSADCVSACSIAFLAGKERYLGESGRLGFHSVRVGELSGQVNTELNGEVRQTLQTHGVPKNFIDRALSTSPKDMWYPSKDELLRAKIIDSVVDSRYFGLSGVTQWRDAHKIESELLTLPIYSALAQYDQKNYAKLRNILVSGIQKGRAQIEIQNDVRSILMNQLIPTYLKKAPDGALIRYWRSQVAEMQHLANLDPQHCADFVYPQYAKTALDLERLLPKELQIEDLNALAAVVKGVATNPQGNGSSPRVEADIEAIGVKVKQKFPSALEVLTTPDNYKDAPVALCMAYTVVFSEVLALPSSSQSGAVLRYLGSE